jgi:hypothetical protein
LSTADFNDQPRERLNLIIHLLDRTPDVTLPDEALELPPLALEPKEDRFKGPVQPIVGPY